MLLTWIILLPKFLIDNIHSLSADYLWIIRSLRSGPWFWLRIIYWFFKMCLSGVLVRVFKGHGFTQWLRWIMMWLLSFMSLLLNVLKLFIFRYIRWTLHLLCVPWVSWCFHGIGNIFNFSICSLQVGSITHEFIFESGRVKNKGKVFICENFYELVYLHMSLPIGKYQINKAIFVEFIQVNLFIFNHLTDILCFDLTYLIDEFHFRIILFRTNTIYWNIILGAFLFSLVITTAITAFIPSSSGWSSRCVLRIQTTWSWLIAFYVFLKFFLKCLLELSFHLGILSNHINGEIEQFLKDEHHFMTYVSDLIWVYIIVVIYKICQKSSFLLLWPITPQEAKNCHL